MIELNKIYNESNLETMAKMPNSFVDLTVTSPPYDGLRKYNGYSFPFEDIAKELFRVTKPGGVLIWVVVAKDHILSWSNEGELVYDPFSGSGTTAKMCVALYRNYIGSETSKEYAIVSEKRLSKGVQPFIIM